MKQQIVQTATQSFMKIGFKTTTMDDICNELGISKKTLYSHYNNKTELVEDCVSYFFNMIRSTVDSVIKKRYNPILEFFYVQECLTKEERLPQNTAAYHQLRKYYPEIYKKFIKRHFDIFKINMTKNIERGIEQGYFRENINKDFVMRLCFLIFTEIDDHNYLMKNLYSQNQIEFYSLEYHIRAIATQKGVTCLEDHVKEKIKINQN